jgi:molecular chaperone DnaK
MLVFDLGGGTFDVTIMEARDGELRTLASDGNAELGGKDWDDRLLDHVSELFFDRFGLDPRDEPRAYQETYEACLRAKITLSHEQSTFVHIQYQGHRAAIPISRAEFEMITSDLVAQCAQTCGLVLDKAGLSWSAVDETLLVGGSTRMPMISRMLHQLTDGTRQSPLNPDECVAMGAALVGAIRHNKSRDNTHKLPQKPPSIRHVTITDVTPHPLGIIALDQNLEEKVITLIEAGTAVPCERRGRFAYSYDNMTGLRVEVTEGRGKRREEVTVVGELVIDNLPARDRGTPIAVVYRYGIDQILEVDIQESDFSSNGDRKTSEPTIRTAQIDLRGTLERSELESIRKQLGSAIIGSR